MSYPNPSAPSGPRALRRSRTNRVVGGVCGGVADYLTMDATLVRIVTVVLTLFTGVPVVLYLVALFLMPEEGSAPADPSAPPLSGYTPYPPAAAPTDDVWGPAGAPWASAPAPRRPEGPAS